MARTALPVTNCVANGQVSNPTATTIDATNGMAITLPTTDIPADASSDRLVLVVANTAASSKNVIVRAGANNPPAFRAGLGDIKALVTNATTSYVGPFDYSRITQGGGVINVDFDSGTTGTVLALLLPRNI
jgi:hypothetical protein